MRKVTIQIIIAILFLMMISCRNTNSTLSLLTNDSIKSWYSLKDQYGMLFRKKYRLYQEFDSQHYFMTTNPFDFVYPERFKINGNAIIVYYDKKKEKQYIDTINIVKLTKDSLWLGSKDQSYLYISTPEVIRPQYYPEFYEGYTRPASLFNKSKVDSLIGDAQSRLSANDVKPDSFEIDLILDLDTAGNIEKMTKVKEIPSGEQYNKFYDILLNSVRSLRFSPAMNKISNEKYTCKTYFVIKR